VGVALFCPHMLVLSLAYTHTHTYTTRTNTHTHIHTHAHREFTVLQDCKLAAGARTARTHARVHTHTRTHTHAHTHKHTQTHTHAHTHTYTRTHTNTRTRNILFCLSASALLAHEPPDFSKYYRATPFQKHNLPKTWSRELTILQMCELAAGARTGAALEVYSYSQARY